MSKDDTPVPWPKRGVVAPMHVFKGTTSHWMDWSIPFRRFMTTQLSKHCDYEWGIAPGEAPLHGKVDLGDIQTHKVKQEETTTSALTATPTSSKLTMIVTMKQRVQQFQNDIDMMDARLAQITIELTEPTDTVDVKDNASALGLEQTNIKTRIKQKTEAIHTLTTTMNELIQRSNVNASTATTMKNKHVIHLEQETYKDSERGQQIIDRDGYALDIIMTHLPENLRMRYKTIVQTRALWLSLERDYGRITEIDKRGAVNRLNILQMERGEKLDDFIVKLESAFDAVAQVRNNKELSDEEKLDHVYRTIKPTGRYNLEFNILANMGITKYYDVIYKLKMADMQLQQDKEMRERRDGQVNILKQGNEKKSGECWTCGNNGHISRNCPDKDKQQDTNKETHNDKKQQFQYMRGRSGRGRGSGGSNRGRGHGRQQGRGGTWCVLHKSNTHKTEDCTTAKGLLSAKQINALTELETDGETSDITTTTSS